MFARERKTEGNETQYFTKKRVCFFDLIKMEKRYTFSMRRRWFVKHEQSLLFARVGKKSLKTKIDVSAALTSIFFYFLNNFSYSRDGLQRKGEAACSQMVENRAL